LFALNIQTEFLKRGYLLLVKPSDKEKFIREYSNQVEFAKLKNKAKSLNEKLDINPTKLNEYMIPLEKLLKMLLAFRENGYVAFTRGHSVLKPNSERYRNFSLNIETWCTIDHMLNLYLLHYKAEIDKKCNDKRFPIPYYVMSFIGSICRGDRVDMFQEKMDELFSSKESFLLIYEFYKLLTSVYAKDYMVSNNLDYNVMIKQEIDPVIYAKCFDMALMMYSHSKEIKDFSS